MTVRDKKVHMQIVDHGLLSGTLQARKDIAL